MLNKTTPRKIHRFRPSAARMVQHERFVRDRRGIFRLQSFEESEVAYCHRVCREPAGFAKGARVK